MIDAHEVRVKAHRPARRVTGDAFTSVGTVHEVVVNVYVMPFRLGGFPGAVQRDGAATRGSGCPSPSGALRVVHEHAAVAARTAGVAVGIGAPAGPKVRSAWRALRWLSVRTPERRSDAFCSSLGDWRMEEVSPPPRSTSWRCSRMGSGIQAGRRASLGEVASLRILA